MLGSEILLTIAELAVAFAGFASIVVIFVHRDPAMWPPAVPVRLRAMVETSLSTLYGALLPLALHHLGLAAPQLWSACSAIGAIGILVIAAIFYRRARVHLPTGDLSPVFTFVLLLVTIPVFLLQLMNASGILFPPSFGVYLLAVLWSLLVASMVFLRMVVHPIERAGR